MASRRPFAGPPEGFAIEDPQRRWSWAQVAEATSRAANALLGMDLGSERRVAVFAENAAETGLAHVGGLRGSASTVPVNFHLTVDEVEYILGDSGAQVVFVGPETAERGMAAARKVGITTVVGWRCPPLEGLTDWEEWLAAADPGDPPSDLPARPSLLYTSGTTGRPKGTEMAPLVFPRGMTVAEHLDHTARAGRTAAYGTHLVVGPMYHTGPLTGFRVVLAGKPVVICGRFDPAATLAAIESHRVETTVMVPTHFVRLLALPEEVRRRTDVSSLRYVIHTGAPCPIWVKEAMIEWWGPVFWDRYGATEVGSTNEISTPEWQERPGSVGRALPPFETVVLGEDDRPVGPGVEGRLYFKDSTGRGIVYHNDPAKSAAAHVAPGVFTLGDRGYVDKEGYVYLTDREADLVISGGVNIYPIEAEHVLAAHPEVADVACIGIPDPEMGEVLLALVVPADPARPPDPAALIGFCRERIAHYKCPRAVELVATVGRTAMGKVDKRALRAPYRGSGPLSRPEQPA